MKTTQSMEQLQKETAALLKQVDETNPDDLAALEPLYARLRTIIAAITKHLDAAVEGLAVTRQQLRAQLQKITAAQKRLRAQTKTAP